MSAQLETLLTNKDLEGLPRDGNRYELIEGELYGSTAPELIHQRTIGRLFRAFTIYLDEKPIGEILYGPGVILSDYDGVIPDLVYLSNERRDQIATGTRIYGAPNLVIEVLSPGMQNMERDRKLKLKLYDKYGVDEYWIADTRARAIEVYRRDAGKLQFFTTFVSDETITSSLLPEFNCGVADLFR
jgi:Uma2 family endonuclease